MKSKFFILILFLSFNSFASEEASIIKDGVRSITSIITKSSKDAISGIKEGLDEGRSSGSSVDGAIVIHDKENLIKLLDIKALNNESLGTDKYRITISIKNKSDSAVRLTNLNEKNNIFIIDRDGFTAYTSEIQNDITIPKNSSSKVRFEFVEAENKPEILRLYGHDIIINNN